MKEVNYNGQTYGIESYRERENRISAVTQELWEVCKNNGKLSVFDVEEVAERLKRLSRNTIIQ